MLKACANKHAAAVFALARWCGLRVPHEPLALKWEHIDFDQLRIRVPADTKTGFRVLPLFPRAIEPMRELRAITPLDQEYVFDRARRSAATTWRDWLLDAIAAAGLHGWPKIWHNLRASWCRDRLSFSMRAEFHRCTQSVPRRSCRGYLENISPGSIDHCNRVR